MNIFYTADQHWSHKNIIKYCCRPFKSVHEMNGELTERWNSVVQPGDIVFHLGDFGFYGEKDTSDLLCGLNGQVILIRGNHDRLTTVKQFPYWVNRMAANIGGYQCLLNHKPVHPKHKQDTANDPFKDHDKSVSNPEQYDYIICGHVHEKWLTLHNNINIGVDQHDFYPVAQSRVLELIEELPVHKKQR